MEQVRPRGSPRPRVAYGGYLAAWIDVADPQREALVREALALLPSDDSRHRVDLLVKLGDLLVLSPDSDERMKLGADAVAMARRIGDPSLLTRALAARFASARGQAGLDEREAWLAEMDAVAESADRLGVQSTLWRESTRVFLQRMRGDFDAARALSPSVVDLMHKAGSDLREYWEWAFDVTDLVTRGRLAEAESRWSDEGIDARYGDLARLVYAANRVVVDRWTIVGDKATRRSLVEELQSRFGDLTLPYAMDAGIAVLDDDMPAASAALARWVELAPWVPRFVLEHVVSIVSEWIRATGSATAAEAALGLLQADRGSPRLVVRGGGRRPPRPG